MISALTILSEVSASINPPLPGMSLRQAVASVVYPVGGVVGPVVAAPVL